jgi:hypothetical protein
MKKTIPPYEQGKTYHPGDMVAMNGKTWRCVLKSDNKLGWDETQEQEAEGGQFLDVWREIFAHLELGQGRAADGLFTARILNSDYPSDLQHTDPKTGRTYIPVRRLRIMLDYIFDGQYSFRLAPISYVSVKPDKPNLMVQTVELSVTLPSGYIRTVVGSAMGASGSALGGENTAASAVLGKAERAAIVKLGRYFGRDLFDDEQLSYEPASASISTVIAKID